MKKTSRIAALLLLVTLGLTFPSASAFALPLPHAQHPAGCSHHMPATPVPISHQCCVAGPQSAMPVAAFSQHSSPDQFCAACSDHQISLTPLPVSTAVSSAASPGTPPSAAPLRI
jgi:hypothetical protein